jgi:hypothetical protein
MQFSKSQDKLSTSGVTSFVCIFAATLDAEVDGGCRWSSSPLLLRLAPSTNVVLVGFIERLLSKFEHELPRASRPALVKVEPSENHWKDRVDTGRSILRLTEINS